MLSEAKNNFTKAGFVAIIGKPNSGKSTLLNAIIGTQLAAVTSKPQTTRKRVLGIYSNNNSQIVFLDTPGLLTPKYKMQARMMEYVQTSINEADCVLCIYDITKYQKENPLPKQLIQAIDAIKPKKIILAINKIDALKDIKEALPVIAHFHNLNLFSDIVPISALKQNNVDELLQTLIKYLPAAPFYYDPELLSTQTERFFVSEIIRENIFKSYGDEIPYSTEVTIVEFKEREFGKWFINAEIIVERTSQKAIIIGQKGEKLKAVLERSRIAIEAHLQTPIYLECFVKVRQNWRDNNTYLNSLGY